MSGFANRSCVSKVIRAVDEDLFGHLKRPIWVKGLQDGELGLKPKLAGRNIVCDTDI